MEHRLPRAVLTQSEAEQVLNRPDVRTPLGIRDRAVLETFYSTGMRRMELLGLAVHDLDLERGTVTIRKGKGKKDRVVPIGGRAVRWIQKYYFEVRPKLLPTRNEPTLFLSGDGKPLEPNTLTHLVRQYVTAADLGKVGACHLFRHTCATLMLENGADVRFIQQMLGHAKLETTAIYTQVSIRKLKEVHERTHPARMERTDRVGSFV
jgi:integrase/recombinase XerD